MNKVFGYQQKKTAITGTFIASDTAEESKVDMMPEEMRSGEPSALRVPHNQHMVEDESFQNMVERTGEKPFGGHGKHLLTVSLLKMNREMNRQMNRCIIRATFGDESMFNPRGQVATNLRMPQSILESCYELPSYDPEQFKKNEEYFG